MKTKMMGMFLLVLFLVNISFAQAKPEMKISGTLFAQYLSYLSDYDAKGKELDGLNAFDIPRTHLNVDVKLSEKARLFLQYETMWITKEPGLAAKEEKKDAFSKQAFLELKDILYPGTKIMFGLIPLPWNDYENVFWKHRFVQKTFADLEGAVKSIDRGVRINTKINIVEADLSLGNGEATGNEWDKAKEIEGRIVLSPFKEGILKGLKINAYVHGGSSSTAADTSRDRILYGLAYADNKVSAAVTSLTGKTAKNDISGFSVFAVYSLTDKMSVFGRMDQWDPSQSADDARTRMLAGLSYKVESNVRAALAYHGLTQEKEATTRKNESAVGLHIETKF